MRLGLALLLVLGLAARSGAGTSWYGGTVAPSACTTGDVWQKDGTNKLQYECTSTNTWTIKTAIPPGLILLSLTACPSGFSEETSLSGKFVLGTVAANADVTGTGGADSITPAGTVAAPTFTGASGTVPAQTFTGSSATSSATSGGTPSGTNAASATSGNCAATNIAAGTGSTTACKATAPNLTVTAQTFTGSALGTHTHTLTATGTNGTVSFTPTGTNSAPAFTGAQFDNRPAFVKVIFCKAN